MRKRTLIIAGLVLLLCLSDLGTVYAAPAAVFVVTVTDDTNDGICGPAHCSLREAIVAANGAIGSDTIRFAIKKTDPGYMANGIEGTWTISLTSSLPIISADGTVIDGASQAVWLGEDANKYGPEIEVSGALLGSGACFLVTGAGNVIHHLAINHCPASGVEIRTTSATGNTVSSSYIGVDPTGVAPWSNGGDGVYIWDEATSNTVGGSTAGDRNVISGNIANGVLITGVGTDSNVVSGNYIGPDASGGGKLGNGGDGVEISGGAAFNIIGGSTGGERNVISDNDTHGVRISGGTTTGNQVMGNYIGIDASGTGKLGNANYGVYLGSGTYKNTIGGDAAGQGNVISGNASSGLYLDSVGGNVVAGNQIGTDAGGTLPLGNSSHGIDILGGSWENTIGGDVTATRNVISGNGGHGVWIHASGTDGNVVQNNHIGTTASGTGDLGNTECGIYVSDGAQSNLIGGNTTAERNVISGNQEDGVRIEGSGTTLNQVQGNYIGTNAAGTSALRNESYGVRLWSGAQQNTIGGSSSGTRNLISGNYWGGVLIRDTGTISNTVSGNYIGSDVTGAVEVSSSLVPGVQIDFGAQSNMVGGSTDGTGNLISGNSSGVVISGWSTDGNVVAGNYIGLTASGNAALPNHNDGVWIGGSAHSNTIGGITAAERNVISGNAGNGIVISGAATTGNTVMGNYVGLNWNGTGAVGNGLSGIYVLAPWNTIGGDTSSERNIIAGNGWFGIELETSDANNNTIAANYIGTDVSATIALGNLQGGIGLYGGAHDNTIGGGSAERNIISGNDGPGIWISGATANDVLGNYIGIKAAGDQALGNLGDGVVLEGGAQDNNIGDDGTGQRNVISGNDGSGVVISGTGTSLNTIYFNTVGLDSSGDAILGNLGNGVVITAAATLNLISGNFISGNEVNGVMIGGSGTSSNEVSTNHIGLDSTATLERRNLLDGVRIMGGASHNVVGGDEVHEINFISANHLNGVQITGAGTDHNTVSGNRIGINGGGAAAGNSVAGVRIADGAGSNTVGGTTSGERNIIAANSYGVWITDAGTQSNTVAGNYIGLGIDGSTDRGNSDYGVAISDEAQNNVIGGTTSGERNVISGNGDGVAFWGSETTGNSVLGNYIGTDASGALGRGNDSSGVLMIGGHDNAIGGSAAGAGNVISGNSLGVFLSGSSVHHNTIAGNYVGTDATGADALPNEYGVYVLSGAHNNAIGGDTPAEGNLISGNTYDGVQILSSSTVSNTVSANYIGTNAAGTLPLANGRYGVVIASAAKYNIVGGDAPGEGNLISGNLESGVQLSALDTMSNTVSGNLIGTDISGLLPLGNGGHGVAIHAGAQYNVVGGDTEDERNIIADNGWSGVSLAGSDTHHNLVLGNHIGTNAPGSAELGNGFYGVHLADGPQFNTIGGGTAAERNVISGNVDGVRLQGTTTMSNTVSGNYIGTDATGSSALGNAQDGVLVLLGAQRNIIGGDATGEGNVISGNDNDGVQISGTDTISNTVSGNLIGLGADGELALGNGANGVYLWTSGRGNIVGGDVEGERNVISNNYMGVKISGGGQSTVSGNYIGIDGTGGLSRPNIWHGVHIVSDSQGNTIGGATVGERNVISGNGRHGVRLETSGTDGNVVSGNYIGTDATGTSPLGNGWSGVSIADGPHLSLVGGDATGAGNLISGNGHHGVSISGSGTLSHTVSGNHIGTNAAGLAQIANGMCGISLLDGPQFNLIGGDSSPARNVIAGNVDCGVLIHGRATMSNTVAGNWIGLDATGLSGLANGSDGVRIEEGAQGNQVGAGNQIAHNTGHGVAITGSLTLYNTITENSIHNNGGLGIENSLGGNTELAPPIIITSTVTSSFVEGTAPAHSRVELFTGPDDEGRTFLAFDMADASGNWSVSLAFVSEGFVVATATDGDGNTSEFSEPVEMVEPSYYVFLPLVVRNH